MPITLSHVAAAVPLRKTGLPTSALVMGAMAPDFEFFFSLADERIIAHTVPGLLAFCLPVGLFGLIIFHKLLKYPLIALFPRSHRGKLYRTAERFTFFPAHRLGLLIAGLLVGALSHIAWDAWTHEGGWFAQFFPILDRDLFYLRGRAQQLHDILGYISSVGGFIAVLVAYKRWLARAKALPLHHHRHHCLPDPVRAAIGSGLGGFAILGGISNGIITAPPLDQFKAFLGATLVAMVSAFLAVWLFYSIVFHITVPLRKRHLEKSSSPSI